MLGNSNFGIITLTRNLRYELLDKSFSISVLHLINFLILCTLNQVDFTGIQAPIYKKGLSHYQIFFAGRQPCFMPKWGRNRL